MKIIRALLGVITLILLILNTIIVPGLTFILYPLQYLLITRRLRQWWMHRVVYRIPQAWSFFARYILMLSTFGQWKMPKSKTKTLSKNQHYLLLSNHQSWFDIIVLCISVCRFTSPYRFFMKRELLWTLPVAGLAVYLVGFPFLRRHTKADIRKNPALRNADIKTTKKACRKFRDHPVTFINFPEGTRYTKEKHTRKKSHYNYLLPARSGGSAMVIEGCGTRMHHVLDTTINYKSDKPSFLKLVFGQIDEIDIDLDIIPVTPDLIGDYYKDRDFRKHFQEWINKRWEIKDEKITKWRKSRKLK